MRLHTKSDPRSWVVFVFHFIEAFESAKLRTRQTHNESLSFLSQEQQKHILQCNYLIT